MYKKRNKGVSLFKLPNDKKEKDMRVREKRSRYRILFEKANLLIKKFTDRITLLT